MTAANNAHHFIDRTDYITYTQPVNVTDLLPTQLGNRASEAESDRSEDELLRAHQSEGCHLLVAVHESRDFQSK